MDTASLIDPLRRLPVWENVPNGSILFMEVLDRDDVKARLTQVIP